MKLSSVAGRVGGAGVGVGDAVRDGHHHRRGRAVAADVGDQEAPAAVGQREEVVVVAAGPLRGLVVRRPGRGSGSRGSLRQERALEVGDDLQLALDDVVGRLELLGEHEVVRRPAEQAAQPDPLGELLAGRTPRAPCACRTTMFMRDAPVEVRDGHQRALPVEVVGGGVVRGRRPGRR